MATIIIETQEKKNMAEIKKIAKNLGVEVNPLTKAQEQDYLLGRKMKLSKKSGIANKNQVLKFLGI